MELISVSRFTIQFSSTAPLIPLEELQNVCAILCIQDLSGSWTVPLDLTLCEGSTQRDGSVLLTFTSDEIGGSVRRETKS